jgi:dTDP-glucose pyrophosphorylase
MLNIVVPMAGRGSRFATAGYSVPKPLISVGGKPMIQWVIENVRPNQPHRFIFICLAEHLVSFPEVPVTLRRLCPGCEIVEVAQVTEGAACTVLLSRSFIDNDDPLMIANADQYVRLDIDDYLTAMEREQAEGLIMTFWADHPKWSYCRMKEDGTVAAVVEKQVVSNEATVGIYNFRRGRDYVRAADAMIAKNLRVNNEFYVAPAYDQLIAEGMKVVIADTGREYDGMFGLGTPGDLDFFLTTSAYRAGRVAVQQGDREGAKLTRELSRIYARFFHEKNIAGVRAMLAPDVRLTDPSVDLVGREAVEVFVAELFAKFSILSFAPRKIIAEERVSVIEFELSLDQQQLIGTDVIEWRGGQIHALRAYLYPVSRALGEAGL